MRRAGYEVRVIPVEGGSYEENPPTLLEFVRRDLRWCVGNLQYVGLLGMPGVLAVSRIQLALAIWMFLASAFNVALWIAVLVKSLLAGGGSWLDPGAGLALIGVFVTLTLAPKLASAIGVLVSADERRAWGGAGPFLAGFGTEVLMSFLLTPILAVSQTATIVAFFCGRTIGWSAQLRSEHRIAWGTAAARFWPHTLAGLVIGAALWSISPFTAFASLPIYGGLLVAIPLTVVTSIPSLGQRMARRAWMAIPEDLAPPAEIRPLQLPALAGRDLP